MATRYGKRIVTDGLVLCLDAADNISAPHNDLPVKQGLLAWWDANDDSTVTLSGSNVTQWRDKSGNGLHMAPNGTGPTRSNTLNSKSILTFTASQDIRNFDAALNLTAVDNTVIIISRYTYSSGSNNGRVLDGGNNNWLLGHWSSATQKYYAVGWVSSSSNNINNDNTWRIYTGTGDIGNDVWQFKVNGTDLTNLSSGGSQGPKYLAINSGNNSNQASDCDVAELIVFNRVLSSDELTKVHNYLQNKWNIPVSDAKWYDRTANANNGTPTNEPTYSETNKGYFEFDGSDDYVDIGNTTDIFPSGSQSHSLTVSLWGKVASTSSNRILYGQQNVANERLYIGVLNGTWEFGWGAYAWGNGNSGSAAGATTNWTNLVLVVGNGVADLYVNGVGTISKTDTSVNLQGKHPIGAYFYLDSYDANLSNVCSVAQCLMYNKALSVAEILQNYNATKGRYL